MRFDASTIFVVVLTAAVSLVIVIINVYGRGTKSETSSRESVTEPVSAAPQNASKRPKSAHKR